MKLRVKDLDISTGGTLVAVLHQDYCLEHDLHYEERLLIKRGKKQVVAIIDITDSNRQVSYGQIGLMEEVLARIDAKEGDLVEIQLEKTPTSVQYIKDKLNGKELSSNQTNEIIKDIVGNRLSQIEMTYFVAGCYTHSLSRKETIDLTKAIVNNGDVFKPKGRIIVDKHCIGGVPGNRTTMVAVPLLAVAGLIVPKTSLRSITSPAGTADTMEVLCNVSIPLDKLKKVVAKTNACLIWGGAFNLATADDRLIRLRHPLSLDPVGMVLASVLAKKHAVSANRVLIDIPVGKDAKLENPKEALRFKRLFEDIGKDLGMKVKVIITDGSEPIGNGIGPALEARDVLWLLKNDKRAPPDLIEKSLAVTGIIFEFVGRSKKGQGRKLAEEILYSGKGYKKMVEIINAQGKKITDPSKIKLGRYHVDIKAKKSGYVKHINNKRISKIAWSAGAPVDKGAGLYLYRHKGDRVSKAEKLFTLYADNREKLKFAKSLADQFNAYVVYRP